MRNQVLLNAPEPESSGPPPPPLGATVTKQTKNIIISQQRLSLIKLTSRSCYSIMLLTSTSILR